MNEEDCRRDDEMVRAKRKKQDMTFAEWIKEHLKGEKSYYGDRNDNDHQS